MAFSEEVQLQAMDRAGWRCECVRDLCATHYLTRCPSTISMVTAVFVRKKQTVLGDPDKLSNCEVLCQYCGANAAMDEFKPTY
ncbi:MAG: hypothetical protein JNM34_01435 [Chthonomonadaceae bacterium]|nr:hypothetical protein [Chthonomonadaceae bacterium]